jgi:hypothetical protein
MRGQMNWRGTERSTDVFEASILIMVVLNEYL